ncbi:hypothetical protein [Spirulina sp. 06S082]|uniref:hypothetical protein n=1 Tax=Spirulina sp. 06S082 TaxID=3110248 RepID=UPI002B1F0205|nr:hypothetical protein [Spirulina sp. 06S082]MEA5471810.1 hypothetical protein [Spirulina sp. 06S082]
MIASARSFTPDRPPQSSTRRSRPSRSARYTAGNAPEIAGNVVRHPTAQRTPLAAVPGQPRPLTPFPERSRQIPFWLRCLIALKHGSSIVTFCLVVAVLMVYSSMVGIQQEWSNAYQKRQSLQRQLQELSMARAQINNHLGVEAESSGLQSPSPSNTIFLEPSPIEPTVVQASAKSSPSPKPARGNTPLGY